MKSHKDLDVWQQAIDIAQHTYQITRKFPRKDVSPTLAQREGAARQGTKEFIQFLYIATGSATELDTQIEISKRTELGNAEAPEKPQERTIKILMMLQGLIRKLKQRLK